MNKIFTPIKIGKLTIKNRFMMAPMENGMAELNTGNVTLRMLAFFEERAKKEVGLIMPGSIGVSAEGRGLPTQLSLFNEEQIKEHKKLVDIIHKYNCKVGAQLYHAGRQASEAITGLTPLAPSAIPCAILGNHPREITKDEMKEILDKFVLSTDYALEAGYDLIEVHFAHGYLLHSFMSTHTNKRTDEYNGSFEARIKYPMDVLKAVIKEVAGRVPVQVRVSVDEFVSDGMHFDEVKELCLLCQEAGVSSISVSAGCYDAVEYAIQPMFIPQGFLIPYAKELKQILNIPVIVAARLNDADLIVNTIENDEADMVAIGRGLIADPDLILKIKNDESDKIRYCIACNQGCIDRVLGGMPAHCLVNPVAGEEETKVLKRAIDNRTISIIGGGPAGLQAAITAKKRGFKVNLYYDGDLGGKLDLVSKAPNKESFLLFKDYLIKTVKDLNVNLINKKIDDSKDIEGDVVIIATGSEQTLPRIEGLENTNYSFAEDVLAGKELDGNIVVIGGGLVGTETAEYLGSKGKSVTIVEAKDGVALGIGATFIGHVLAILAKYKVKTFTGQNILKVDKGNIILENAKVPYDNIVIATGYKSTDELEQKLSKKFKVYKIGDASKPRRILEATEEAFDIINSL